MYHNLNTASYSPQSQVCHHHQRGLYSHLLVWRDNHLLLTHQRHGIWSNLELCVILKETLPASNPS